MASWLREDLCCPICHEIYKDPVILSCSHSFCKACWQRWWTEKVTHECAVCKTKPSLYDPPKNLALKNICEDFSSQKDQRGSEGLCSLHGEKLKLFCLDHQQPVCLICSHSSSHTSHKFSPIDEAALNYKKILQELLRPFQEKLELFNDIKRNFDQTAKDIEAQAEDTERQIKDEFLKLQKFLQKEEQVRIGAVREEKKQKSQMMKVKTEALSREMAGLSGTVGATEEVLKADDLVFLQSYKTAAEMVQFSPPEVPKPIPALIDMTKHLNNLSMAILGNMKETIASSEVLDSKTHSEPMQYNASQRETVSKRPLSRTQPVRSRDRLGMENGPGHFYSGLVTHPHPLPATFRPTTCIPATLQTNPLPNPL